MARGDKDKVTQTSIGLAGKASGLADTQAAAATAQQGQNQRLESSILPSYQQVVAHPGYTPQQKAAITTAQGEAVGSAYGSAKDALARRAARTRNSAGYGGAVDELARDKSRTMGEMGAGLQERFADTAFKQRMAGLGGEAGLYGVDAQTLRALYGMPSEDIRAGASALGPGAELAGRPGFWGQLGGAFAQSLGRGLGTGITGAGG